MTDEPNLFDPDSWELPEPRTLANRNATQASKEAAEKIAPQLKGIKKQILDLLENEPDGLTLFELVERTGLKVQTVSGRPGELMKKNLIFADGFRMEESKRKFTVYKHAKFRSL